MTQDLQHCFAHVCSGRGQSWGCEWVWCGGGTVGKCYNVANRESGQLDSYMRESCHARLTAWHAVHLKHRQSTANNK